MAFLVALVVTLIAGTARADSRIGDFVGWEGESYDPVKIWGSKLMHSKEKQNETTISHTANLIEDEKAAKRIMDEVKCPEAEEKEMKGGPWVEQLSWQPRAFLYHGFLTDEECDHMIELARPLVKRSLVVSQNGADQVDNVRTSLGTFVPPFTDEVVAGIIHKIERWTHLPMANFEFMNVLRYGVGQKYAGHIDTITTQEKPRIATVLMYMSNIEEGGETAFPLSNKWLDPSMSEKFGPFSACAEGHVAVKPKKGDALLFYSLTPEGAVDELSYHTGCPVLSGTKWTGTVWIHNAPVTKEKDLMASLPSDPGLCLDDYKACATLAENDGCQTDTDYMSVICRRTCQLCTICKTGDHECYNKNRENANLPRIEDVI